MDDYFDRLKNGDPESWLLAFAVYSLLVGAFSLFHYTRIGRWPSVIGALNSAAVAGQTPSAVSSDRNYSAEVSYQYNIEGKSYEGSRLSPFLVMATHNLRSLIRHQMKGIEIIQDGGVRVFYNPARPEKSYLISTSSIGYASIISIMFLPLVAYLIYTA